MNEKDIKQLKRCIESSLSKTTKGQVVYWKNDETKRFEFRRVHGDCENLTGFYVFEFDVFKKIRVPFADIEHVVLTEVDPHNDPNDKYDLKGFYD